MGQPSGEAAKIYLLSRKSGNVSSATVSVLTDRLSSFIGLLTVSVLGFAMSSSHFPPRLQHIALDGEALLVGILLAFQHDAFSPRPNAAAWIESRTPGYSAAIARERRALQQWHIAVGNLWRMVAGVSLGGLMHIINVMILITL